MKMVSKSKVAPMTKQSIPRLELLGALCLARLVDNFKSWIEGNLLGPLLDWLNDSTMLDQKSKGLETVRATSSRWNSQPDFESFMATLSRPPKSRWLALVWFDY